jgi:tetratricopeptide (TPR) repeat protein
MAASLDNDSLKVSALNSLGNTHLARNENLLAFRNFLQALNMAEDLHSYELLKNSYNNMSNFYVTLGEYEKAKDYLFKLQRITQEFRQPYDRLNVYRSIALVYAANKQLDIATRYYEKMIGLADTVRLEIYKLNAYFDITNQYINSNQGAKALAYFNAVPEMKRFLVSSGNDHYLFQVYASAHAAMQRYDSAEYYFKKAEQGFEARTNRANRFSFYSDYADYHAGRSDYQQALVYWLKAQKIAEDTKDLELQSDIAANLDTTYQKLGDYRNAYAYKARYHHFKDSLEKLSTEKDLLLLEVENENRRKEKELTAVEEARRERHNIQYMGITAGIAGVFIVLVMLGIFSVSKTTIRILGFFAFIFLFEFIILLADTEIHHLTHGEPWKILAIKIGLISILLPLHHFLEERVIHYLTSRKLLAVNAKGLLQKFTRKGQADPVLKH